MWRDMGERFCGLQEMDQQVIQQNFYGPQGSIKLHNVKSRQKNIVTLAIEDAYDGTAPPIKPISFTHPTLIHALH